MFSLTFSFVGFALVLNELLVDCCGGLFFSYASGGLEPVQRFNDKKASYLYIGLAWERDGVI